MFEKNLFLVFLLDFYGEILSERKRTVMDFYYNEDFSLSEISEKIGISRQGVRDIIKKSEEELFLYEEKLGLAVKLKAIEEKSDFIIEDAKKRKFPEEFCRELETLRRLIVKI